MAIDPRSLGPKAQAQIKSLGKVKAKRRVRVDNAPMWAHAWRAVVGSSATDDGWESEWKFHPTRKWRFDWARREDNGPRTDPCLVAVEVDGGTWLAQGGRHNKDEDRWKLAEAAALGWTVFQFTPKMLTDEPDRCVRLVCAALGYDLPVKGNR